MNAYQKSLNIRIGAELSKLGDPKRVEQLLPFWNEIAEQFVSAPAAHKLSYHHCWQGGLAEHSLSVLGYARKLAEVVMGNCGTELKDAITVACLFHDLGKSDGYYIPLAPDDWKRRDGTRYSYVKDWHASHAQRSLWMLQSYGVVLTSQEYRAILLHDGQYVDANKRFGMNEPDLALVVHWADVWDARHACTKPTGAED